MLKKALSVIKTFAITAILIFIVIQKLNWNAYLVSLFAAIADGLFSFLGSKTATDGVLTIDTSDPEKDKYLFTVETPLEELPKRNYITLRISREKHRV